MSNTSALNTITKSALTRLARKGGVKTISGLVFEEARNALKEELTSILKKSIILTEHLNFHTLNIKALIPVLPVHMYVTKIKFGIYKNLTRKKSADSKKHSKSGVISLKEIKHYQKQQNTFLLRKAPFFRLVIEIGKDFFKTLRYTKQALLLLQVYIEDYMVKLFNRASLYGIHAQRIKLYSTDIVLAKKTLSEKGEYSIIAGLPSYDFESFISKICKQIHPDIRMSTDVKIQMNYFVNYLGKIISQYALFLASYEFHQTGEKNKVRTISSKDIITAVKIIFPTNLADRSVEEMVKFITTFTENINIEKNNNEKTVAKSRSSRAGLFYPVHKVENIIRNNGAQRVSGTAGVCLTAALEYISTEILELSGNSAIDNKRTIRARDLMQAIKFDNDLDKLFKDINMEIMGGGVIVNIHESLIPKKK